MCSGPTVVRMTYSPSRAASAVIWSWSRLKANVVFGDVQGVVLGHLVAADDLADPNPDLAGAGQAPGIHSGDDLGQLDVGGFQQCQAFAGPLDGQGGVAAGGPAFPPGDGGGGLRGGSPGRN